MEGQITVGIIQIMHVSVSEHLLNRKGNVEVVTISERVPCRERTYSSLTAVFSLTFESTRYCSFGQSQ